MFLAPIAHVVYMDAMHRMTVESQARISDQQYMIRTAMLLEEQAIAHNDLVALIKKDHEHQLNHKASEPDTRSPMLIALMDLLEKDKSQ